jgi:hypothetical protein
VDKAISADPAIVKIVFFIFFSLDPAAVRGVVVSRVPRCVQGK